MQAEQTIRPPVQFSQIALLLPAVGSETHATHLSLHSIQSRLRIRFYKRFSKNNQPTATCHLTDAQRVTLQWALAQLTGERMGVNHILSQHYSEVACLPLIDAAALIVALYSLKQQTTCGRHQLRGLKVTPLWPHS